MKRIFSLALILCAGLLVLVACGEDTEDTAVVSTSPVESETTESAAPSETAEAEKEEPEPEEVTEEASETPAEDEQQPETTEEAEPEAAESEAVELPSTETVTEMADQLSFWIANSSLGEGKVELNFDAACEVAANVATWTMENSRIEGSFSDDYLHFINKMSEDDVSQCLHNLFGSGYQLADYTHSDFSSALLPVCPDYVSVSAEYLVRSADGSLLLYSDASWMDTFPSASPDVLSISPAEGNSATCTALVRYSILAPYLTNDDGTPMREGYEDVTFDLKRDEGSAYGWVITAIQQGAFQEDEAYAAYQEQMYNSY